MKAFYIDNFLTPTKFKVITNKVETYSQYTTKSPLDLKDDFFKEVRKEVIDRFDFYGIYQDKMRDSELGWVQFSMAGQHIDTHNHTDNGGFAFYIHPDWDDTWEGEVIIDDETKVLPKPNRLLWINPNTLHKINDFNLNATHSRVACSAFLDVNITDAPTKTHTIID